MRTSLGGLSQFWLRPLSIRVKSVKVRKLNFFRSLCTYVNIFSYSSKNIRVSGGGPGACLQNMEGETTLEYLGGVKEDR